MTNSIEISIRGTKFKMSLAQILSNLTSKSPCSSENTESCKMKTLNTFTADEIVTKKVFICYQKYLQYAEMSKLKKT